MPQIDPEGVPRTAIYSGLFSHALYLGASPLELYMSVAQNLMLGIEGVYFGDRTNQSGPVFQPSQGNVELLLQPNTPFPPSLNNTTAFAYFAGSWGIDKLKVSNLSVTCFFNNFTAQG